MTNAQAIKTEEEVVQDNEKRAKYVVFRNKGAIDVKMITTFGISAKSDDNPNPIGYFGTGLKYAIAVLLREGIPITIYSGDVSYNFDTKIECMRGKEFKLVCLNGEPIGFTTDLGKNWELWQAFRELYSNCVDEFGKTDKEEAMPEPAEGITQVVVESEKFVEIYENRHEIFLQGQPLVENKHANIHGGSSNHVFYRGIRIGTFKEPLMYRYNIQKHIDLTEDRTIKYNFQINDSIVDAVLSSRDEKFIESVLMAPENSHEANLNFLDNRAEQSEEFRKVAAEIRRTRPEKANKTAIDLFERDLKVADRFETFKPSKEQQDSLTKAIDFLTQLGYPIDKYQIQFVVTLGESTLALAEDGKMYLSGVLFDKGTKYLAATIFEEYVHLQYGYKDCSREMQNFLFEHFMSLAEKLTGEAL